MLKLAEEGVIYARVSSAKQVKKGMGYQAKSELVRVLLKITE